MKDIKDILNESLLDDEEKLFKDTERNVYAKKIINIFDKALNTIEKTNVCEDMLGKHIEVGDLVLIIDGSINFNVKVVETIVINKAGDYYLTFDNGKDQKFCFECIVISKGKFKDFLNVIS